MNSVRSNRSPSEGLKSIWRSNINAGLTIVRSNRSPSEGLKYREHRLAKKIVWVRSNRSPSEGLKFKNSPNAAKSNGWSEATEARVRD